MPGGFNDSISWRHTSSGATLYATAREVGLTYWDVVNELLTEIVPANWADYVIAMSEVSAGAYLYVADFPIAAAPGWYWVDVFLQADVAPAIGDTLVATHFGYWDGNRFKWWANDTTHIGGTLQNPLDMGRIAALIIGNVSGARTGTEVFVYGGVTATVTADSNGNRTIIFT